MLGGATRRFELRAEDILRRTRPAIRQHRVDLPTLLLLEGSVLHERVTHKLLEVNDAMFLPLYRRMSIYIGQAEHDVDVLCATDPWCTRRPPCSSARWSAMIHDESIERARDG